MKVLIIEDSQDILNSLQLCFKICWPEAQLVFTNLGENGVSMVKAENPDFIILDLGLPDVDGRVVLKRIREFSKIPVMILSVRNQDSDVTGCYADGADSYMTKPFSALKLISRVRATYEDWLRKEKTIPESDRAQ